LIKWWTVPRLSASENGYEMGNLGERAQLSLLRVLYAPYNKRVRRTRSSEWSWSFNCPLPSSLHWEQGRRTSPDSAISQGSGYPVPFKNQEIKSNVRFREAVQFIYISVIWGNLWYFRISQLFKGVVFYRLSQLITSPVIFGFLLWYPKFWINQISAYLIQSTKFPIVHFLTKHNKFSVFSDFIVRHAIYTFSRMWIGQGKPTMAGGVRFVQQILTFWSRLYCGLADVLFNQDPWLHKLHRLVLSWLKINYRLILYCVLCIQLTHKWFSQRKRDVISINWH
jgi:hypothetical protein